ncbi:MAG: alpha/beta fold hydrolase [Dehalococcoidia bacterium]|nr:alpha/beta fold hydrolase [Dehalococcoidia bacterium]
MSQRWPWFVVGVLAVAVVALVVALFVTGDSGDEDTPASGNGGEETTPGTDGDDESTPGANGGDDGDTAAGEIAWDACAFTVPQGVDVECGYLEVPENRDDPDGGTVRLHLGVFQAQEETDEPPLVFLSGGPGGAALEPLARNFPIFYEPWTAERDLVVFDQRGTGHSEPSLACPEHDDLVRESVDEDVSPDELGDQLVEALYSCRDRLVEEGVNLSAYNSAASAADMEALREALGYEQWDVYGISYGTRLALKAMREYPDGIRSAVLDSAYPLEADLYESTPGNVDRALTALFESCASDDACSETYPNLEATFLETVEALNAEPAPVEVPSPLTGTTREGVMTGHDLVGLVFQSLYATPLIPYLPEIIVNAAEGELSTGGLLLGTFMAQLEFSNIGMQLSVQCREETPFGNAEAAAEAADEVGLGGFFAASPNLGPRIYEICEEWDAGEAPPEADEPVASDIPTLVFAGSHDPITPPSWGADVAESLSNGALIEFPATGHGVATSHDCAEAIMFAFLSDPSTEPDTGCIGDIGAPVYTPGNVEVEMETYTNEAMGYRSARPAGWIEVQPGVYQESVLVTMAQRFVPGATPEQLLDTLATQMGLDELPEPAQTITAQSGDWDVYETTQQGLDQAIAVAELDGQVAVTVVAAPVGWGEAYFDAVLEPAVEAFEPGVTEGD